MHYTFPHAFDLNRALELGALVDASYSQLDHFKSHTTWTPPAGYHDVKPFTAIEPWAQSIWPPKPPASPLPFGFVATKGRDVYVVIRGTQTTLEWFDDFTIQPQIFDRNHPAWGHTTVGFAGIHHQIFPQITHALQALLDGGNDLSSLYLTGHSLGAALAHLAAAAIFLKFHVRPVSYTFCGPRAGDPDFLKAYTAAALPTWRIFNTEDIVPTVPLAAIQFASPNMGIVPAGGPLNFALLNMVKLFPGPFAHVGFPIAVSFHRNVVADNHNLDGNLAELARP